MSKIEIKLNPAGVRAVLRSSEVREALRISADEIASRCGEGYEAGATVGYKRALAHVRAATPEAVQDNYDHNTLLKAVKG